MGGKTALELTGKAQYLKMKEPSVVVILSTKKEALPSWMKNYDSNAGLNFKVKNLFNQKLAFAEKSNCFITIEVDHTWHSHCILVRP